MIKGSVDSLETFGLLDGPGIRTVVFLSGCRLRCKYCHNPEMWIKGKENYTKEELARKTLRNKTYFKRNSGGVTFSGGEPLLQSEFVIEVCKLLKKEGIHIALDTAGVGNGDYDEILSYVDLVLFDIKHVTRQGYKDLTGHEIDDSFTFIEAMNRSGVSVWIRQVIVPGVMDNDEYLKGLKEIIQKIKNVQKIEFLPYHKLGDEKYQKLGIFNPYQDKEAMDAEKCRQLYEKFMRMVHEEE